MEKSNIIISIIIVLCIAAAVAAYGITNSNNPIFSDLSSMPAKNTGNGAATVVIVVVAAAVAVVAAIVEVAQVHPQVMVRHYLTPMHKV